MPVEAATSIATLNPAWPLGTDFKEEGDNHIRLIKSVLQTDFAAEKLGAIKGAKRTVITASNPTWAFDAKCIFYQVEAQGPGGAGGNSAASIANTANAGSGGGAGGYAKVIRARGAQVNAAIVISALLATWNDTIGLLTGNVGAAGANGGSSNSPQMVNGGLGGTATGGDINRRGDAGQESFSFGQSGGLASVGHGGLGASSLYGPGGQGGAITSAGNGNAGGGPAAGFGAGGGGACSVNAVGVQSGGAGSQAAVIVTEWLGG